MTQRSDRPTVGNKASVDALKRVYDASWEGPRAAIIDGAPGSGRRTLVRSLLQDLDEGEQRPTYVRMHVDPTDDGIRSMLKAYGAVVTGLGRSHGFDTDVATLLDGVAESTDDNRVNLWLVQLATSVRELTGAAAGTQFQFHVPADNPWLAMLHAFDVVGPRTRWIIDLGDLGACISPAMWVFLSALVGRARARNWKVLFVLSGGPNTYGEKPSARQPGPRRFLSELFSDAETVGLEPLRLTDVAQLLSDTYRPNSFPEGLAEALHGIAKGHPETLHEVLDALEEDETILWDDSGYALSDLDDVDIDVLVPMALERDDEEEEEEEEDADVELDPELMEKVLYVGALEGKQFTASLIRTVLGADEDAVDDSLDAMPHVVEEGDYHQVLGTWTYRFRYEFYRQWYLDNPPESLKNKGDDLRRALGKVMLQSYAPASFEYIPTAARMFSEGDDAQGARTVMAMALGADRVEIIKFSMELSERFGDSPWPSGLLRLIFGNFADRMVNGAQPDAAQQAVEEVRAWAVKAGDVESAAYTRLLECRVRIRQGNWEEAKRQGEMALQAFREVKETTRAGETLNQLAMIALNMGDSDAALRYVKEAGKESTIPPVKAHSLYIGGLLDRASRRLPGAEKAFQRAAKLATEAGNLVLALESMINHADAVVAQGRGADVADELERALEMSRALQAPQRERLAARLMCQAEAARGNGEAAFEMAKHALELTQELGGDAANEHIDLYHCGIFAVMAGKQAEALDYLGSARSAVEKLQNKGLLSEILYNMGQIKVAQGDVDGGKADLDQALGIVRAAGDAGRELRVMEGQGNILSVTGDHAGAIELFQQVLDRAKGPQAKQLRKQLRQRITKEREAAAKVVPAEA